MRQQGMNTAYNDKVVFSTPFCVVSTGTDAEGEFVFYPAVTLDEGEIRDYDGILVSRSLIGAPSK